MRKKHKCDHSIAEAVYDSKHLAVVTCPCGKSWSGDPNKHLQPMMEHCINRTPKWVITANNKAIQQIRSKRKSRSAGRG